MFKKYLFFLEVGTKNNNCSLQTISVLEMGHWCSSAIYLVNENHVRIHNIIYQVQCEWSLTLPGSY